MIDAHPDYCGPSPSHLIRTLYNNIQNYGNLNNQENWKILVYDVTSLLNFQLGAWEAKFTEDEFFENVNSRTIESLIKYIYEKEATLNGKRNVFIKENQTYTFAQNILNDFDYAKFVYLVRDPRDMALSWKLSFNHPGAIMKATEIWFNDQRSSIELFNDLGPQKVFVIRYEDLLGENSVLEELCNFLEVKYNTIIHKFHNNNLTKQNSKRLKDWGNLGKPLIKNNFNKYRKSLTNSEIKYIEQKCKNEMAFFNYSLDFDDDKFTKQDCTNVEAIESQIAFSEEESISKEISIREKRIEVIKRIIGRNLS